MSGCEREVVNLTSFLGHHISQSIFCIMLSITTTDIAIYLYSWSSTIYVSATIFLFSWLADNVRCCAAGTRPPNFSDDSAIPLVHICSKNLIGPLDEAYISGFNQVNFGPSTRNVWPELKKIKQLFHVPICLSLMQDDCCSCQRHVQRDSNYTS